MPLLRKALVIPSEGANYAIPSSVINDRAVFPKNMSYYRGELRKVAGKSKYGSVAIGGTRVMGLGILETSAGTKYLIRTSLTKTEYYNTSTGAWDSISASDWTGGDDDFHFFATATPQGYVVFTNGINLIRKWTGAGNNAALGGSPDKAKFLAYVSPYLLLAHIDDGASINPWKVAWCDTNDPETWSGGNSGSAVLTDEPSPIRNILKLNEFAGVYKRDSLWLGRKLTTTDIFDFTMVRTGVGLAASRAVADVGGQHFFMGLNDFWAWNGAVLEPIGKDIRDEVFSRISRSNIGRCHAIHIKHLSEVWFFVVVAGGSWPTEIWKYNYRNGFWYYDTCDVSAQYGLTAAISWERTAVLAWNNAVGTWNAQLEIWDSGITIGDWDETIFGRTDGHTLKLDATTTDDDGNAVEAQVVTKDFIADSFEKYERWLQLDIWAKGPGNLKVYYSIDYGENWVNIPFSSSQAYFTLTDQYQILHCYFDIVGKRIRFKFVEGTSGKTFYLRNVYAYYVQREQIR